MHMWTNQHADLCLFFPNFKEHVIYYALYAYSVSKIMFNLTIS